MEAGTETEAPRVFVSYSHDSPEHQTRVLELVQWLRMQGVNAWVDQFEESPPGGWARWCQEQVEEAKYVLVVCTETYERRAKREEEPGVGLGTVWEMGVIIDLAYRAQDAASKLIPVIFEVADKEHIPYPLNQETHYDLSTEGGEEDLYRRLTDQPDVVPMTLGQVAEMPSPVSQPRQAPRQVGPGGPAAAGAAGAARRAGDRVARRRDRGQLGGRAPQPDGRGRRHGRRHRTRPERRAAAADREQGRSAVERPGPVGGAAGRAADPPRRADDADAVPSVRPVQRLSHLLQRHAERAPGDDTDRRRDRDLAAPVTPGRDACLELFGL